MHKSFLTHALTILGILAALSGCQGTGKSTYPNDPLFVSKKPLQNFAHMDNGSPALAAETQGPTAPANRLLTCPESELQLVTHLSEK